MKDCFKKINTKGAFKRFLLKLDVETLFGENTIAKPVLFTHKNDHKNLAISSKITKSYYVSKPVQKSFKLVVLHSKGIFIEYQSEPKHNMMFPVSLREPLNADLLFYRVFNLKRSFRILLLSQNFFRTKQQLPLNVLPRQFACFYS